MKKRVLKNGSISEKYIQKALFQWINLQPTLRDYVFSIPNEGPRSARYGKELKDMGMRPGVSDIFIAIPKKDYSGMWLELKSAKGALTELQILFQKDMAKQGYHTAVAYSLDEAMASIDNYLS